MPLPKRRHSIARQGKRRANWKIEPPALTPCPLPECRALKLPHVACPVCGTYKGEKVMTVKPHIHRGRA